MPRVSQFYGIAIYMYYNDHAPPHFHAIYGESEVLFAIDSLDVLEGNVPRRVRALVVEWGALRHAETLENWDLARRGSTAAAHCAAGLSRRDDDEPTPRSRTRGRRA